MGHSRAVSGLHSAMPIHVRWSGWLKLPQRLERADFAPLRDVL
jgi:hypothetical protein